MFQPILTARVVTFTPRAVTFETSLSILMARVVTTAPTLAGGSPGLVAEGGVESPREGGGAGGAVDAAEREVAP